jgi:hypothetical protein
MENSIEETMREAVTSVTMDMHRRGDHITESEKDQVNVISVPINGHIQVQTDTVQDDKSENFATQIKHLKPHLSEENEELKQ